MKKARNVLLAAFVLFLLSPFAVMAAGDKESSANPELVFYYIGTPQADEDLVNEKVNEYIEPLIGATIDMNCLNWGEYENRMKTIIGSGENYDICFSTNWTNNYKQNIAIKAFMPLNDLIDNDAPMIKEVLGDDFLYATAQAGVLYTIPCNKEKAHNFGLLLRKDLVEKYNMDLSKIKKLEDMDPYFKTIKENEENVYALGNWGSGDNLFLMLDWDRPVGSKVPVSFDQEGNVVNMFEESRTLELFKLAREFYQKGYEQADAATLSEFVADEAAGIIFATPKSLKPGKDGEYAATTPGYEWVQVEFTEPVMSNSETDGSMMAISVGSKHPKEAIKFLELLYTDKYLVNLLVYGVEGIHYTKISDNVIRPVENTTYNSGLGWVFGNQFLDYLTENEASDKWEQFLAYNDAATPAPNLGFNFDPANVSNEISACLNIWDQYTPSLTSGSVDDVEGYVQKALEAFKAAGVDTIIAEVEKQYDAWKAAK